MTEQGKRAIVAANTVGSTLDNPAKSIFAHKEIIAPVLQLSVPEFKDCSIEEIVRLIDADSIKDDIPVEDLPPLMIDRGTELSGYTEKDIFYDKHFIVKNPKLSKGNIDVMLHIDFEVQNNYRPSNPDYQIVSRAMYYAARELGSQLGPLKENTDYGELEKVYSIWVCNTNVPVKIQNTMSIYSMKKEDVIGTTDEPESFYDLMSVIIIRRGSVKKRAEKSVLDYLSAVFEGDLDKVDNYTAIKDNPEIRKEVENMGGIGEALVNDAMLGNLQHQIEIGLITNENVAVQAYPTLRKEDIHEVFILYNSQNNQS